MMNLEKGVTNLINAAKLLGLREADVKNAIKLVDHREYGLAFDVVVTQLYEYEIGIDPEFYNLVMKLANMMNIPEDEYSFMKELMRS